MPIESDCAAGLDIERFVPLNSYRRSAGSPPPDLFPNDLDFQIPIPPILIGIVR